MTEYSQHVMKGNGKLFSGAVLLKSSDFRQTLLVIPRSTFADEINVCSKQWLLLRSVKNFD